MNSKQSAQSKRIVEQLAQQSTMLPGMPDHIAMSIRNVGHAVIGGCVCLREDEVIVSFSVGLSTHGLPEVVLSGAGQRAACIIINDLAPRLHYARAKGLIPEGVENIEVPDLIANGIKSVLRRLPTSEANQQLMPQAREFFGRDSEAMQLLIADRHNRYQWEGGTAPTFDLLMNVLVDWNAAPPPDPSTTIVLPRPSKEDLLPIMEAVCPNRDL